MKLASVLCALTAGGATAFTAAPLASRTTASSSALSMESKADVQALAKKLNPIIGYWDPLNLNDAGLWGTSDEFTIAWFRHSEIKHSRIAMAAFVGYCVQSNFVFPWPMTMDGQPFPSTDLSPPEQWDALPFAAKVQIIAFIGFLEWYSELSDGDGAWAGQTHYTKGGKPGKYPTFDGVPHSVPFNLFDPFKFHTNLSQESRDRRLVSELNNGRLAMLGIFGFLCEQKTEGAVPLLQGIVKPYAGEPMAPFSADFTL